MYEKLKSFISDDTTYFAIVVVLVGIVSFGLGRLSVVGEGVSRPGPTGPAGIVFTEAPIAPITPVTSTEEAPADMVKVVGSRSGKKYHLLDCPGAVQIKEDNKVYFDSIELAKAAGYEPAANCPGLR